LRCNPHLREVVLEYVVGKKPANREARFFHPIDDFVMAVTAAAAAAGQG